MLAICDRLVGGAGAIEAAAGVRAQRELVDQLQGDMENTYADISLIADAVGYQPHTGLRDGISAFVDWYRDYYKV